ncbi:MAG: sugar ABC transporter substrate-binding protein [Rhodococcus sp. (in: high G+C Gram-positive bacteria)]
MARIRFSAPLRPHQWRRGLAVAAAGAMLAVGLTACSSGGSGTDSSSSPVTISFWSWVPGIEKAVAQWNKQNPDIHVKFTRISSADSSKTQTAVEAGTGPDVAQFSQHDLPDYVIKHDVLDITKYVGSTKNRYTASSWQAVDFSGHVYAVPQDSGPHALMYRKDIFEQYGLTVPKTWDEYIADAKKLHAANPKIYIAQFSANEPGMYYGDMVQGGGSWYGTKGDSWTVDVNSAANKKVFARYQTLLDDGLVKNEQMWTQQYWSDVNNGTIASINYAAWFPTILESNTKGLSGKWAVAPSPSDSGNGVSGDSGGSVNAIMKGAKHPEQAAKFITWLNSSKSGVDHLIEQGGLFPSAKIGQSSSLLQKSSTFFGGQNINKVFQKAASHVPTKNVEGPQYEATYTEIQDQFAKVSNGTATFDQALNATEQKVKSNLKSAGLSVK